MSPDQAPVGLSRDSQLRGLGPYLRGQIGKDNVLVNESVIGSLFSAKIIQETTVGDIPAVIPEISGTAYISGFSNWIIDDRDPQKNGFLVR